MRIVKLALVITGCAFTANQAAAQALEETTQQDDKGKWEITLAGGYIHQFEADPNNSEGFDVERFGAAMGIRTRLSEDLAMSLRFNFSLDMYDFGGGSNPFGGHPGRNPWEDIYTFTSGALFAWDVTDDINVFGGPMVQSARESGAGWDHSWVAGGAIGASYAFGPELRLGAGLGFFDELGDDWKYFLIPVIEWKLNDQWRVSTSSSSSASRIGVALTGVELIWGPTERWEFALGFAQNYSRFRLDDTGPAARGVGQDEGYPLWLRAVWNINDQFQLDGVTGVLLNGELDLINSAGATVASADYDPAFFIGVFGSIRF